MNKVLFALACLATAWTSGLTAAPIGDLLRLTPSSGSPATWRLETTSGALVELSLLRQGVFRLRAGAHGVLEPAGDGAAPIVVGLDPEKVAYRWIAAADHYRLETAALTLRIDRKPLRFSLYAADRKTLLWREEEPLDLAPGRSLQTLSRREDEHFFGGGQQNGAFEFAGKILDISYSGGWEEGDRPNPAPFFLSSRGYGILRNTWKNGSYDFREPDSLRASHQEERFDAYYFVGRGLPEVLTAYTEATGRARLLPRWAYEYGDADCYNDGDNAKKPGTVPAGWSDGPTGTTPDVIDSVAKRYRELDMPGGWILPNDGYGCGYTNLPEVVKGLAAYGFHTGLWTENGVDKIAWEVGQAGTRAQKLDVAWTGEGYQHAMDANGAAYAGLYQHSDARPFLWTVMGWAGIQRYAVTWTGDQSGSWDYIRWHIPTLIGSGLSGQVYATGDVDGIFGGSPETYTRDLQWKTFTPVLMGMSGWSRTLRKHPWAFAEPHLSIHRQFLKLRQRLMPYIYTLAHDAESLGAPLVRGLLWDHPGDPNAFTEAHKDQFVLGRDLLVAPVYRSQAASGGWRRGIYVPAGTFIDYWDGRLVEAGPDGLTFDRQVSLAEIPIFVRAGAILPMYPASLYDGQVAKDELTLDLYPHGHSSFTLYEDDGLTRQYQNGSSSRQQITLEAPLSGKAGDIAVEIAGARGSYSGQESQRFYRLRLLTRLEPAAVLLDGRALPRLGDAAALATEEGYFYDPADRFGTLEVHTTKVSIRRKLVFRVKAPPFASPNKTPGFPPAPAEGRAVPADNLLVIGRPLEEPGHPLENAFDGNSATWFRTTRNQAIATGPHEFTVSLGRRRVIDGLEIAPRTDQHWKYGQPRDIEIYLGDNNGDWGEPAFRGRLAHQEGLQVIAFPPRAGKLLRFRVLTTHDPEGDGAAGADPLVLAASKNPGEAAFSSQAPAPVAPITLSELHLLEHPAPAGAQQRLYLADLAGLPAGLAANRSPSGSHLRAGGLPYRRGLDAATSTVARLELEGEWQVLRADVGLDATCPPPPGGLRFEIRTAGRLLWSSGQLPSTDLLPLELDIRGLDQLELAVRGNSESASGCGVWGNLQLQGPAAAKATWRP